MKLKIYKFNNVQANILDDIEKVKTYFQSDFVKQFINIDLSIDYESTNIERQNTPQQLFYPNDGKYDAAMYVYEKGTWNDGWFGLTFNVSTTLVGIYLNTDLLDDNVDYTWKSMCHEIVHALSYMAESKYKTKISNVLDSPIVNGKVSPFYGNDNPFLPNGNFQQALELLTPFYSLKNALPSVLITRSDVDTKQTLGNLVYRDFNAKTLELPDKGNLPNVSRILTGVYLCKYTFSLRMLKYTYELQNVNGRSGIRIHVLNFWWQSKGCIGLGSDVKDINNDGELDLVDSSITVKKFEQLLNKKDFYLTIK